MNQRWNEIKEWEESFFTYDTTDLAGTYNKWNERLFHQLGQNRKQKWLEKMDACLIHFVYLMYLELRSHLDQFYP